MGGDGSASSTASPAAKKSALPPDPTKGIKVNRTVPKVAPAKALNFSKEPKDSDFVSVHVLSEPLVPVGEKTSPGEKQALAAAITAFSKSANPEATAPLTGFS